MNEVKLGAEERVAELTARWQAPSTINFYNRLRLHYGHRCVITTGNTVSQDRPSRGVSLNKTKINFVSMIFLLFRPSLSLVLVEGSAFDWRRQEAEQALLEENGRGLSKKKGRWRSAASPSPPQPAPLPTSDEASERQFYSEKHADEAFVHKFSCDNDTRPWRCCL